MSRPAHKPFLSTEIRLEWVLGLLLALGGLYYSDGRTSDRREMDGMERRITALEGKCLD